MVYQARNVGLLYVTKKGKKVSAKNPRPVDCNKCRFPFNSVISEADRATFDSKVCVQGVQLQIL